MNVLIFLIVFPLVISVLALALPRGLLIKRIIGVIANVVLCAVPIYLLVTYLDKGPAYFHLESHLINTSMLVVEILIAVLYCLYFHPGKKIPSRAARRRSVIDYAEFRVHLRQWDAD